MTAGDLYRTMHVTALYVDNDLKNHDRHGDVGPRDVLVYLGESFEDYDRVFVSGSGKTGWVYSRVLEKLDETG